MCVMLKALPPKKEQQKVFEDSSKRKKSKIMIFKLETPEHQRAAIQSVVEAFRGMEKNTYDNATDEDIRA